MEPLRFGPTEVKTFERFVGPLADWLHSSLTVEPQAMVGPPGGVSVFPFQATPFPLVPTTHLVRKSSSAFPLKQDVQN